MLYDSNERYLNDLEEEVIDLRSKVAEYEDKVWLLNHDLYMAKLEIEDIERDRQNLQHKYEELKFRIESLEK